MADDVVHDDQTPAKRSGVEILKERSHQLRGTIPQTLASDVSHFSHDEYQLLKFHGVYQQDDRDPARGPPSGAEKSWMMMVRAKFRRRRLTADQYLRFDALATHYGNETLRVTSRQCFQLHYIGKGDLQQTIQGINESLITTLGACGDVERNLVACPAPNASAAASEVQRWARHLSDQTLPRTRAYHEIWLDHEKIASTQEPDEEPLYGNTLPAAEIQVRAGRSRATTASTCTRRTSGWSRTWTATGSRGSPVLVGGGMGMTHNSRRPTRARPAPSASWSLMPC